MTDFDAVKQALESNYACMGITCADIGGYKDGDAYRTGFAAGCTTDQPDYTPTGMSAMHDTYGRYASCVPNEPCTSDASCHGGTCVRGGHHRRLLFATMPRTCEC